MADTLDKDFKTSALKMLEELKVYVEEVNKGHEQVEITAKRQKI